MATRTSKMWAVWWHWCWAGRRPAGVSAVGGPWWTLILLRNTISIFFCELDSLSSRLEQDYPVSSGSVCLLGITLSCVCRQLDGLWLCFFSLWRSTRTCLSVLVVSGSSRLVGRQSGGRTTGITFTKLTYNSINLMTIWDTGAQLSIMMLRPLFKASSS